MASAQIEIFWYDYLVFIAYNCLFSFLLVRAADLLNFEKRTSRIFLALFQTLFFLIFFDTLFHFIPLQEESSYYELMINTSLYPQDAIYNLMGVYYFILVCNIICLGSIIIYHFLLIFLFILASMIFLQSLTSYYKSSPWVSNIFACILIFYPAVYLINAGINRTPLILFCFSIFISGIFHYLQSSKWQRMIIGGVILCLINLKLIPFTIVLILFMFMKKHQMKMWKSACIYTILIILSFILLSVFSIKFDSENIASYRDEVLLEGGTLAFGKVSWTNYLDVFREGSLITAQFLLSPFPVFSAINLLQYPLLTADGIFILILLLLSLFSFRQIKSFSLLYIIILMYLILFGSGEFNLLFASWNRVPIIFLLIFICANVISKSVAKKDA